MQTLTTEERDTIHFKLRYPPTCPARAAAEKLAGGGAGTEDLLDMDVLYSRTPAGGRNCMEIWIFRRLLEDHRIRAHNERQARQHPTTQERDRRRWRKTIKNYCASMTAWCRAARK